MCIRDRRGKDRAPVGIAARLMKTRLARFHQSGRNADRGAILAALRLLAGAQWLFAGLMGLLLFWLVFWLVF